MSNEKHFEKATLLFDQILTTLKPPPKKCLKRWQSLLNGIKMTHAISIEQTCASSCKD
jgi:hypothetical protein